MADNLRTLPVDNSPLNHNELSLVNQLFQNQNSNTIIQAAYGLKDVFIASIVFFGVSLPYIENGIKKIFPVTINNTYMMILIKTAIFAIIFFVLNNFYLTSLQSKK